MLIVKSTSSLNSIANDRVTTQIAKDLPRIAKKAGWSSVVLADERTMAGAVDFLATAASIGLKASVGLQLSRLTTKNGGEATLIVIPLAQSGFNRLVRSAATLCRATTIPAVLDALEATHSGLDLVVIVMPAPGFIPAGTEASDLASSLRRRGANCAVAIATVGGEEMNHAPWSEAVRFAGSTLPMVRLVEGMTPARLDDVIAKAVHQFAGDCIATRRLPAKDRIPQAFDDLSIPQAAACLTEPGQAVANAIDLFGRIGPMTASRRPDLPRRLGLEPGQNPDDLLREKARAGLAERIAAGRVADPAAAWGRLEYELDVMIKLEFSNYFLIKTEAVEFARRNDIPVGPGRGSAAGSMVVFALGITNIDPLAHKLLFERFINPHRISLPDIDSDFCPDRRTEVLRHLVSKYGDDHVAQISVYGTLKPKGAVRKAATLLKMQGAGSRAIAIMAGRKEDVELKFDQLHKSSDAEVAEVGRTAKFLHKLANESGIHPAGVILSDDPVEHYAPLATTRTEDGLSVVQYDMKGAEDAGFVKFDFLGLRTLTIIDHCLKALRRQGIDVDLYKIAMDDPDVYEMLRQGRTLTVFQLEGGAITRAGREIGITCFEDIVALVALYRPGPMANIPLYASRKHGRSPVEYLHPVLETVLEDTFGIIIYQEQIMQMARDFAGYSMPEADQLRRAIGKKIKADVEAEREPFVTKAVDMGRDRALAEQLFEFILPFAQYGFNRSHAVAYAVLAYQTAYLKRKHPGAWYASCLTYKEGSEDVARIVTEAATTGGFAILPPTVNDSERGYSYVVEAGIPGIRMPLECVQGVGKLAASEAIAEREANGRFDAFTDFTSRVASMNKAQIESLVWAGAFDAVSASAPTLSRPHFAALAQSATLMTPQRKREQTGQIGLFGAAELGAAGDPPPRCAAIDPEDANNRQAAALQNVLQHERRGIASSAWRREMEPLPMIAKAAGLAKTMGCNTMGILRKQADRMVPQRDGGLRRVIQVTIEDEGGSHQFDVSNSFAMGPDLIDANGRCVRISLGPNKGFSFISAAPEVIDIQVFKDPLREPRDYPAVMITQEIDAAFRETLRGKLRKAAIDRQTGEAKPRARAKRGDAPRKFPTHMLVVPPSRAIEVFRLPSRMDTGEVRDVMEDVPSVTSVLD